MTESQQQKDGEPSHHAEHTEGGATGRAADSLPRAVHYAVPVLSIVILLAFIVGTGLMAWGSHSRSPQNAERGKTTLVIAFCAAVLLAMGTVIINAAWNLGAGT